MINYGISTIYKFKFKFKIGNKIITTDFINPSYIIEKIMTF